MLDEMLTDAIAAQLRDPGQDVRSVVGNPALIAMADAALLAHAAAEDRALATRNIKDCMVLDADHRAAAG